MISRSQEAAEKKRSGKYNCAQAVACTYCDIAGIDSDRMLDITSAFGTGMGTLDGTCGALVGAGVVAGCVVGDRVRSRAAMKQIMEEFKRRHGAVTCRALKGIDTRTPLLECNDCVAEATSILEETLLNRE